MASSVFKLGPHKLATSSPFTTRFVPDYVRGIDRFSTKKDEGLAVMSATHKNIYFGAFPLSTFDNITPGRNAELIEACKKIADINGIVALPVPEIRKAVKSDGVSAYELYYSFLRGLRPTGVAKRKEVAIDTAYRETFPEADPNASKDSKEAITQESPYYKADPLEHFQEGALNGISYELFYHLYPYAPFHFMVIPQKTMRHNQCIDKDWLKFAWDFLNAANDPNLRLAFNSLGAFASQNHLHFQGFYVTEDWTPPIEQAIDPGTADCASLKWPIPHCLVFKGNDESVVKKAWEYIEFIMEEAKKHPNEIAFNLYIKPGSITVIPRRHQATIVDHLNGKGDFSTGPAWIETLGTWIVPKEEHLKTTENDILDFYKILSLGSGFLASYFDYKYSKMLGFRKKGN